MKSYFSTWKCYLIKLQMRCHWRKSNSVNKKKRTLNLSHRVLNSMLRWNGISMSPKMRHTMEISQFLQHLCFPFSCIIVLEMPTNLWTLCNSCIFTYILKKLKNTSPFLGGGMCLNLQNTKNGGWMDLWFTCPVLHLRTKKVYHEKNALHFFWNAKSNILFSFCTF